MQTSSLAMLNLSKLSAAEFRSEPFEYLLVDDFLQHDGKQGIARDFPRIEKSGSFPLSRLSYGPVFKQLTDELLGPDFAAGVGAKFSMDLSPYPTMLTVRGHCDSSDGGIHTDSKDKVITVLLYLNPDWENGGGRLRLLRSKNLEDYVAEVPPTMGSLIIFKRSDRSWHGHKPFEGRRMSLQMNWVKNDSYLRKERFRHEVSSFVKGLVGRKQQER
jgi:SM-20-related protein